MPAGCRSCHKYSLCCRDKFPHAPPGIGTPAGNMLRLRSAGWRNVWEGSKTWLTERCRTDRFFFLLIVLLLLLVSCDVTNVPNKTTSKTDYNLSREIVFEKTLTKDEMKNIVSEALNKIAELRGYQTKVFIQKTKDTSYGKAYSANVEEIVYSDEKYYQGYIKEVNIDNDGETVEYFCKDDKVYY